MKALLSGALGAIFTTSVWAQDLPESVVTEAQGNVMYCLMVMGEETSWPQCAGLLFSPCAENEVGTQGHSDCLKEERAAWEAALDAQIAQVRPRLTPKGDGELAQIMDGWIKLVSQNCNEVSAAKSGHARQSAQFGCEISEIAGAVTEFRSCEIGLSNAPYCEFKE